VLVNNAALDFIGAIEEQDDATIERSSRSTSSAPSRCCDLVLPECARAGGETIVNVSSMDGWPACGERLLLGEQVRARMLDEALWQEIRAARLESAPRRAGLVSHRPSSSHQVLGIADRRLRGELGAHSQPDEDDHARDVPRRSGRAAQAIYDVVAADPLHTGSILGSDAYRRIGAKLDQLRAEYEAGKEMALGTAIPTADLRSLKSGRFMKAEGDALLVCASSPVVAGFTIIISR